LEFHMGIRIASNTWRAPLQLIDSWLPAPVQSCLPRRPLAPLLTRFARAGWLGKVQQPVERPLRPSAPHAVSECPAATRTAPVRTVRSAKVVRGSARLVISGRMADVCAELDRLAALEQPTAAA
jgi:hypothetical protein